MKCPACQTFVTKIPVNWKCPYCGERLPDPSRWYLLYTGLTEYLDNKGAIFWSITFGILLLLLGIVELLFGHATLLSYLGTSLFMTIFGVFFTGMLADMLAKINLPLRLMQGTDFIIKERAVIRRVRKITNLSALAGLIFALFWLKPGTFLEYFPAYAVTVSWFLALAWSVNGLWLDVRMVEDVRFRAYMDRLGITSLKRYRRIGAACIGLLVMTAVVYNVLISINGLWIKFSNLAVVGVIIGFFKQYFSWML